MRSRLVHFAIGRGPETVVVLLFLSAALVYGPYAGDIEDVIRPKSAVAVLAAFALGALALMHHRSQNGPRSSDRVLGVVLTVYLSAWLLSAAAVWPGGESTWRLLRHELVFGLSIGGAVLLPQVRTALLRCLPWMGLLIATTVLLQSHGVNAPGLPDDWLLVPLVKLPAGTFAHRNGPAYLLALCILPTLWNVMRIREPHKRLLWIAGLCVLVAALFATRCRGAVLATLAATVVLAACRRSWVSAPRLRRAHRVAAVAIASAVLASLVGTLPTGVLPVRVAAGVAGPALDDKVRENTIVDEASILERFNVFRSQRTVFGRFQRWRRAIGLMTTAPVLGHGPGGFQAAERRFAPDRHASRVHNMFLEAGSDAGIPGFLALVALFILALYRPWRQRRVLPEACIIAAMVVMVAVKFSLEPLMSNSAAYYGIVLGAAVTFRSRSRARAASCAVIDSGETQLPQNPCASASSPR